MLRDTTVLIIPILGGIGELVWAFSIVECWVVDPFKAREFYGTHKIIRNLQCGFMFVGFLYFMYALFTHQLVT